MNGYREEMALLERAKRNATIELIIKDTLRCCLRPIPDPETLSEISAPWDSVLAEVPIEQLYDVYLETGRRHGGHEPVTAFEIAHTWRRLQQEESLPLLFVGDRDAWKEQEDPN